MFKKNLLRKTSSNTIFLQRAIGLVALALICSVGGQALASSTQRASWDSLVARSEAIMRGRCASSQSYRDLQTGIIWTRYKIQALEWYKGTAGAILTVTEPGGIVDGIGQYVPGACRFQVGEDVILFLFRTELGKWRVRGQGQGYFRIQDASGGRLLVHQAISGAELVATPGSVRDEESWIPAVCDLDSFLERLRQTLAGVPGVR